MALFGPKDFNLPLLTQLYQLEIDEEHLYRGELDRWAGRVANLNRNGYMPNFDTFDQAFRGEAYFVVMSSVLRKDKPRTNLTLREFATAHEAAKLFYSDLLPIIALIKSMMDTASDLGGIWKKDAEMFNTNIKHYRPSSGYSWKGTGDIIPLPDFKAETVPESATGFEWLLLRSMEDAIVTAHTRFAYFRRCRECNSVFLAARSDQIYCSKRDNNRVAARKNYYRVKLKIAKNFILF